jgi:sulfatase modifying factor 1
MRAALLLMGLGSTGCGLWVGEAEWNDWWAGQTDETGAPGDTDSDTDTDADSDTDSDTDADTDVYDMTECLPGFDIDDIQFVSVSAGSFTMGSDSDEVGRDDDEDAFSVTLSRGFRIGAYEIINWQFEDCLGYLPYTYSSSIAPAAGMSWSEAALFANAVSRTEGLEPCYDCEGTEDDASCELASSYAKPYDCEGYRLPTEAEWEFAARGGASTAFSNGGDLVGYATNCDDAFELSNGETLDSIARYCYNAGYDVPRAGTRDPNPLGLYDVHGTVWEWVDDSYEDYPTGSVTDPWGGRGNYHVFRGGGWGAWPKEVRSANREWIEGSSVGELIGLRLVKTQ